MYQDAPSRTQATRAARQENAAGQAVANQPPAANLIDLLLQSPLVGSGIKIEPARGLRLRKPDIF